MINLILTAVMIASLCGMVFCNRKHKKNGTRYQLMALGLLVVVIACGGYSDEVADIIRNRYGNRFSLVDDDSREILSQELAEIIVGNV